MGTQIKQLTPMVFVADLARSIAVYKHLGFAVGNTFAPVDAGE